MLTAAAIACLLATPDADSVFRGAIRAHEALRTYAVSARVARYEADRSASGSWDLVVTADGPPHVLLDVPGTSLIVSDGATVRWLDLTLRQYRVVSTPEHRTLAGPIKSAGYPLDEAQTAFLGPGGMAATLRDFRRLGRWQLGAKGSAWKLEHLAPKGGSITLLVDSKTTRLVGLSVETTGSRANWSFRYRQPPRSVAFRPPDDAVRVQEFDVRTRPPRAVDPESKALLERTLRAYDGVGHAHFIVERVGERVECWFSGARFRQRSRSADLTYDGKNLVVVDRRRKVIFSGRAGRSEVVTAAAAAGTPLEPMLRWLSLGENPLRQWLRSGFEVRWAGKGMLRGSRYSVMMATGSGVTLAFDVSEQSGLVHQITASGPLTSEVGITGISRYSYPSWRRPLPPAQLQALAPAGYEREPLVKLSR
jgi:hypothetical protein